MKGGDKDASASAPTPTPASLSSSSSSAGPEEEAGTIPPLTPSARIRALDRSPEADCASSSTTIPHRALAASSPPPPTEEGDPREVLSPAVAGGGAEPSPSSADQPVRDERSNLGEEGGGAVSSPETSASASAPTGNAGAAAPSSGSPGVDDDDFDDDAFDHDILPLSPSSAPSVASTSPSVTRRRLFGCAGSEINGLGTDGGAESPPPPPLFHHTMDASAVAAAGSANKRKQNDSPGDDPSEADGERHSNGNGSSISSIHPSQSSPELRRAGLLRSIDDVRRSSKSRRSSSAAGPGADFSATPPPPPPLLAGRPNSTNASAGANSNSKQRHVAGGLPPLRSHPTPRRGARAGSAAAKTPPSPGIGGGGGSPSDHALAVAAGSAAAAAAPSDPVARRTALASLHDTISMRKSASDPYRRRSQGGAGGGGGGAGMRSPWKGFRRSVVSAAANNGGGGGSGGGGGGSSSAAGGSHRERVAAIGGQHGGVSASASAFDFVDAGADAGAGEGVTAAVRLRRVQSNPSPALSPPRPGAAASNSDRAPLLVGRRRAPESAYSTDDCSTSLAMSLQSSSDLRTRSFSSDDESDLGLSHDASSLDNHRDRGDEDEEHGRDRGNLKRDEDGNDKNNNNETGNSVDYSDDDSISLDSEIFDALGLGDTDTENDESLDVGRIAAQLATPKARPGRSGKGRAFKSGAGLGLGLRRVRDPPPSSSTTATSPKNGRSRPPQAANSWLGHVATLMPPPLDDGDDFANDGNDDVFADDFDPEDPEQFAALAAAPTPRAVGGRKKSGSVEVAMASAAAAAALAAAAAVEKKTYRHIPSFGYREDGDGGLDVVPAVSWGTGRLPDARVGDFDDKLDRAPGSGRNSPVRFAADAGGDGAGAPLPLLLDVETGSASRAFVGGIDRAGSLLTSDDGEETRLDPEAQSIFPAASGDEEGTLRTAATRSTRFTHNTALSLFTILPGVDLVTLLYLSAFAVFGETIRVFTGRLFGVDCEGFETSADWFVRDWFSQAARHVCVTSTGTTEHAGGAFFADLPANMLGCFVMGIMTLSADWPVVPWLRSDHDLQTNDAVHLAIRTGLCGSLTTFASWNTQMVVMMDGTGRPRGSQVLSALLGYLVGLQCGVASFLFGRHVGVYLNRWRNPHLRPDGDNDDDVHSAVTRVRNRSRRRSTNNRLRRRNQSRPHRSSSAVTERHANIVGLDGIHSSGGGEEVANGLWTRTVDALKRERALRRKGRKERREAAKLSITTAASSRAKSPSSSISGGKARSKSGSRGSGSAGHSGRSSKSTTQHRNSKNGRSSERKDARQPSSSRRHRQDEVPPPSGGRHRHQPRRTQPQQQRHPPNIIVLPPPTEVLSATDSLLRLPSRACARRTAPVALLLAIFTLYLYGDASRGVPFYRTMWLSVLFTPPGAVLRWKLSRWNGRVPWWCGVRGGGRWIPAGTLAANVLGSLVSVGCAVAAARLAARDDAAEWEWAVHCLSAVKVGFAGSLSTVSTFVKEVVDITERYGGRNARGYKYAFGTMAVCCLLGLLVYSPVVRM